MGKKTCMFNSRAEKEVSKTSCMHNLVVEKGGVQENMHVQFRGGKRGWSRKLAMLNKGDNSIKVANQKTCTFKNWEENI